MEVLESRTCTAILVSLMKSSVNNLHYWIAWHGIAFVPNNILPIPFKTVVFYLCSRRVEACMQRLA